MVSEGCWATVRLNCKGQTELAHVFVIGVCMFGFLNRSLGVAVRHQNGSLTYEAFNRLLGMLTHRLDAIGLSPGDRVAAVLPNSLELLMSYYACLLSGLVFVPINDRLSPREVRAILADAKPGLMITSSTPVANFADLTDGVASPVLRLDAIHEWLTDEPPGRSVLARSPWPADHPGVLFYTSGSTGTSKGVLYTHRTLIENSRVFANGLGVTSVDHSVLCHCMASNFMFSQLTIPFLDVGGSVEIVDFGSVEQTLQAIIDGATFLSLVPWFGYQLIEAARTRAPLPNRIRVAEVGGDRVPLSYFYEFEKVFGLLPREHLGMTEANTYTSNPLVEGDLRLGSVGKVLPEVDVEIRDPARHILPARAVGEIWVKTPGRMEAYWADDKKTRKILSAGWVASGDAGYLDEDGYLWLSGRIRHLIICDGDNIYPGEVESQIVFHPLVDRACVFGLAHARRGEVVAAAVILKNREKTLTVTGLEQFLCDRLSEVKIPKALLLLDRFPLTAAGKLDRNALAAALEN